MAHTLYVSRANKHLFLKIFPQWIFEFLVLPTKVGQLKDMEKVKAWTDHVISHF